MTDAYDRVLNLRNYFQEIKRVHRRDEDNKEMSASLRLESMFYTGYNHGFVFPTEVIKNEIAQNTGYVTSWDKFPSKDKLTFKASFSFLTVGTTIPKLKHNLEHKLRRLYVMAEPKTVSGCITDQQQLTRLMIKVTPFVPFGLPIDFNEWGSDWLLQFGRAVSQLDNHKVKMLHVMR